MTIDDYLADVRGRVEKATEGPWRAGLQWTPGAGVGVLSAKSRHDNEDVFASCCDHGAEPTDAQFIAHARQDVPCLLAAVDAVLAVHRPELEHAITGGCANEECDHENACPTTEVNVCRECWSVAEWASPYFMERGLSLVTWPCPTVQAITAALGVTS